MLLAFHVPEDVTGNLDVSSMEVQKYRCAGTSNQMDAAVRRRRTRCCSAGCKRFAFLFAILLVADLFHPLNDFAVEIFGDGKVGHGGSGRSAMPMFFAGRKPNDIAGSDFFDRATLALRPAATGADYERLSEGMRVPCRPRARFKRHAGAGNACRIRSLEQGIDAHRAGEPIGRSFIGWL
jgi:hypothetical protein